MNSEQKKPFKYHALGSIPFEYHPPRNIPLQKVKPSPIKNQQLIGNSSSIPYSQLATMRGRYKGHLPPADKETGLLGPPLFCPVYQ